MIKQTIKGRTFQVFLLGLTGLLLGAGMNNPAYGMERMAETNPYVSYTSEEELLPQETGTSYFEYQWALKNNGTLRRISRTISPMGYQRNGPGERPMAVFAETENVTEAVPGIDIGIEQAWNVYEQSTERRPVTVALIDTGVDISHPELQDAIWVNEDEIPGDGIDNDNNGYVDDVHGWNFYDGISQLYASEEDSHGTHGAGTIAGAWNGQGISGIADSSYVKLMVLKALGSEEGSGDSESVKQAIRYAERNGADICNLSLGSLRYDSELEELIRNSRMLFVVSAGNGDMFGRGYDIDAWPVFPASYPEENVITVGNLMFDGNLSESSNYGAAGVDIAAPGTYILSTVPGGYGFMSGTSMAAPMVTGVAALVYSSRPDLDLAGVRQAILGSARKLDTMEGKTASGGILNAYGAITYGLA